MTVTKLPEGEDLGTIKATARPLASSNIVYLRLDFNGINVNIYYRDAKLLSYFVSILCARGLKQYHVANAGGKLLSDVHITRQKR